MRSHSRAAKFSAFHPLNGLESDSCITPPSSSLNPPSHSFAAFQRPPFGFVLLMFQVVVALVCPLNAQPPLALSFIAALSGGCHGAAGGGFTGIGTPCSAGPLRGVGRDGPRGSACAHQGQSLVRLLPSVVLRMLFPLQYHPDLYTKSKRSSSKSVVPKSDGISIPEIGTFYGWCVLPPLLHAMHLS